MTEEKSSASEDTTGFAWLDGGIVVVLCWIALAAAFTFLWPGSWFAPGDFRFPEAMLYHSLSVPLLVLFFMLAGVSFQLPLTRARGTVVLAVSAALLAGVGSLLDRHTGISAASVVHILGMFGADLVGIVLATDLLRTALGRTNQLRTQRAGFWLLLTSVVAVLVAAPLGHLAGWGLDLGLESFPGVAPFLGHTGMNAETFQDTLVSSHSHLIVAAVLCGLSALAALRFDYAGRPGWRSIVNRSGLWIAEAGLVGAAVLYLVSAFTGWEPPTLFASDPNGMPLDDVLLTMVELGFLALAVGLSGPVTQKARFADLEARIRSAVRWNWILGFLAAVALGIYIEFHEIYYGGGSPPAPGAASDLAYIRAHLLFSFLFLPIVLAFLLAVGESTRRFRMSPALAGVFVRVLLTGMFVTFLGELVWFASGGKGVFVAGAAVLVLGLLTGAGMALSGRFGSTPQGR